MWDILKAVLFGIVEGITEWLPISSTGHLILLEEFVHFENVSENFFEMFEVVIQLGAILAVVVLYWNKIFPGKRPSGVYQTGCDDLVVQDPRILHPGGGDRHSV